MQVFLHEFEINCSFLELTYCYLGSLPGGSNILTDADKLILEIVKFALTILSTTKCGTSHCDGFISDFCERRGGGVHLFERAKADGGGPKLDWGIREHF